jgi:D-psicose/D-tagatose/L-ribulose 3-epimerase
MAALHLADSNRLGLGRGQLDVAPVVRAARAAGYEGPLVLEFTAPGPNPFEANKGDAAMGELDTYLRESVEVLRCV